MAKKPQGIPWAHDWSGRPNFLEPVHSPPRIKAPSPSTKPPTHQEKLAISPGICAGCFIKLPPKFRYKRCNTCRSGFGRRGKYS